MKSVITKKTIDIAHPLRRPLRRIRRQPKRSAWVSEKLKHQGVTMKPHPHFLNALQTAALFVCATLALCALPTAAFAARILSSDGVTMDVSSFMVGSRFTPPIDHPAPQHAAFGAPVEAKAYVGTKNFQKFLPFEGFRFHGIKDAFAKADLNANGAGGVGISGIHETFKIADRDDARMLAQATFTSTLRNIGDSGGAVDFTFQIPQVELAVYPEGNADVTSPFQAGVFGLVQVKHFAAPAPDIPDDTGALKNDFVLFEYAILFDEGAADTLSVSEDLLADAGPVLVPNSCDLRACVGLRFDPFEVTKTVVDDLLPGERLEYEYAMSAFTNFFGTVTPDGQAGVAAFYGDPLEIGGGSSSFVIHDLTLTPAPVPLPGTLGLMLPGLLWLKRRTQQQPP
jgi:hypothetical protein